MLDCDPCRSRTDESAESCDRMPAFFLKIHKYRLKSAPIPCIIGTLQSVWRHTVMQYPIRNRPEYDCPGGFRTEKQGRQ